MKRKIVLGIALVGIAFVATGCTSAVPSGYYDAFAQCLTDAGAKEYGAYWCPHCQDQKEMFGDSADKVPYIECALPGNPQAMTAQCKDDGIEGYPTWVFADGSRLSGVQSFETLGEKTGCEVPAPPSQ